MLKLMDKVYEAMIVNLTVLIESTENETFRDAYIDALGMVGEGCAKISASAPSHTVNNAA